MRKGDKVIISGPNGYELGVVIDPKFNTFYTLVEVATGTMYGMIIAIQDAVLMEYDDSDIDRLVKKHGYEKRFPQTF